MINNSYSVVSVSSVVDSAGFWLTKHSTPQATPLRPPEGWWETAFALVPNASEASGHKCGSKQMLTLVAYDIREPKRLAKIAKTCEDFGVRIQYSVFECRLEADAFDRFWNALNDILDPEADRVTAYKVCASCAKDIRDAGVQTHSQKVVAYVF